MRKYYDYDDEEELASTGGKAAATFFQSVVHLSVWDWVLAGLAGAVALAGLTVFAYPNLNPEMWNNAVVAAGLRPPRDIVPGIWNVLASVLYLGGVTVGNVLMQWAGRVNAALSAMMAYVVIYGAIGLLVSSSLRVARRRRMVMRIASFAGALFFVCADPVWRAGQTFSPWGFLVLASLLAMALFISFMRNGRLWNAHVALVLMGVITAESPIGVLLTAGLVTLFFMSVRYGWLCNAVPLLDPLAGQSAKWMLTFSWFVGLALGITANCWSFIAMGGMAANSLSGGDLPLLYAVTYWQHVTGSAGFLGGALVFTLCFLPAMVAAKMLPNASDEEKLLPYHEGALYIVAGIATFAQVSMISPLWFWSWSEYIQVPSDVLMICALFACAFTVATTIVVLGVELCCRDHARLVEQRFAEISYARESKRGGTVAFVVIFFVLVGMVLPGRMLTCTREMLEIIEDYADEVLAECGKVKWIFTDGRSDDSYETRFELGAAASGGELFAISMMADNEPYQQMLRKRGIDDAEDMLSLTQGASILLRSWMRDKPERMQETAIQLGFELWKRDGKEIPVCSGVLARPIGMSPADCEKGVKAANELGERMLAFWKKGGPARSVSARVRSLFNFAQWRVARIARMRAERLDRAGDEAAAKIDCHRSDELDNNNPTFKRIMQDVERMHAMMLRQVSPREGLQLALQRADFVLARRYAEPILEYQPNNASANFAMAMSYYTQKQWTRSEGYFHACLKTQPKEAAAWNNLAIVCMETKRFDEADKYAKKALELIPQSAEVKDTIKKIAEARRNAAKEAADKNAPAGENGGAKK